MISLAFPWSLEFLTPYLRLMVFFYHLIIKEYFPQILLELTSIHLFRVQNGTRVCDRLFPDQCFLLRFSSQDHPPQSGTCRGVYSPLIRDVFVPSKSAPPDWNMPPPLTEICPCVYTHSIMYVIIYSLTLYRSQGLLFYFFTYYFYLHNAGKIHAWNFHSFWTMMSLKH